MYKNLKFIIFDLFDVILPGLETFISKYPEYKFLLSFDHKNLRKGNISYYDFLKSIGLNDIEIEDFFNKLFNFTTLNFDIINFILNIKLNNNFKIILLSDTSKEIIEYLLGKYDFFDKLFDKIYFSYNYGKTKKQGDIFLELVNDGISLNRSLLIDDSNRNLKNAKKFGLKTYLYTNFIELTIFYDKLCLFESK